MGPKQCKDPSEVTITESREGKSIGQVIVWSLVPRVYRGG